MRAAPLPAAGSVEETDACFIVRDHSAYVKFSDTGKSIAPGPGAYKDRDLPAGSSRHITAFSVGRPVPGPRLQPATTSGRVCRHQQGGSSQAGDYGFGQHGSSAEPSIVLEKWVGASQLSHLLTPTRSGASPLTSPSWRPAADYGEQTDVGRGAMTERHFPVEELDACFVVKLTFRAQPPNQRRKRDVPVPVSY